MPSTAAEVVFDARDLEYISSVGLRCVLAFLKSHDPLYRVDDEPILKVFYGVNSRSELERTLRNVRQAFVRGIPTIIPFDTVRTDAGLGIVHGPMRQGARPARRDGSEAGAHTQAHGRHEERRPRRAHRLPGKVVGAPRCTT